MDIKVILKYLILLCVGGIIYVGIELLWRGRSHISMFFVGGACFVVVGLINEFLDWATPLWQQCLIGSIAITLIEFISGCILNIGLGLNVWNYSNLPFNILGQVSLVFSLVWFVLSGIGIVLDDYLRYWFFGEEKPRYRLV